MTILYFFYLWIFQFVFIVFLPLKIETYKKHGHNQFIQFYLS